MHPDSLAGRLLGRRGHEIRAAVEERRLGERLREDVGRHLVGGCEVHLERVAQAELASEMIVKE